MVFMYCLFLNYFPLLLDLYYLDCVGFLLNALEANIWFSASFSTQHLQHKHNQRRSRWNHNISVNFLQIIQTTEYQNHAHYLLKQRNGNFLLLCFWQAEQERERERKFPFGGELTTCWRLFRWRSGLACATVNKLKCWEVWWARGALSGVELL